MDRVVGKIMVLREICENKNILFGPFSEEITLQRKVDIWNQVLNKAKSVGLISYDKDYKYMRDVCWQNLKRSALGKRSTRKSGREKKFSPIDDLVMEILQKSPGPVPPMPEPKVLETFTTKLEDQDSRESTVLESVKHEEEAEEKVNHNPNIVYLEDPETSPVYKKRRLSRTKLLTEDKMRKRKMALQLEQMELQNYKLKLEVLEMEQKLGFSPSKYTKSEKWLTYENMKEEIMEKMRKLEEERHTVDLWSCGPEWGKKRRKRQVTVAPPYVVYMLPDSDIMEDWRLVRKLLERGE